MDNPYNLKRPKAIAKWLVSEAADKQYMIFDKKRDNVYITKTGKTVKLSDKYYPPYMEHNVAYYSQDHKTEFILKDAKYGRKNMSEFGRILWFRKSGNTTYAQLDEYEINYERIPAEVYFEPACQYKFNRSEQKMYRRKADCYWGDSWHEIKNIKLPSAQQGIAYYWMKPKYHKTIVYTADGINLGTDLKYADIDFCNGDPYMLIGYISNFLKYPAIELLQKSGFENIVEYRSNGGTTKYINWRGKSLPSILKMSMGDVRRLRKTLWRMNDFLFFKELREKGIDVWIDDITVFNSRYCIDRTIKDVSKYTSAETAIAYIKNQNKKHHQQNKLEDYADYLNDCADLKLDLTNRKILRPKNFYTEHIRIANIAASKENEILHEKFRESEAKITRMESPWTFNGLMIRPASGPEELSAEGAALGHCVGGYKQKVADGRCAILFVRLEAEPEKPYYTLELSPDGKIIQCRGKYNKSMTQEVEEFINKWIKDRKDMKTA